MPPNPQETQGLLSREIYSERILRYVYDWVVLGFNLTCLWRCPTRSVLLPFFQENFSSNHLDCGVATGYFPATCLGGHGSRQEQQRLALLDFNPNSLAAAKRVILSKTEGQSASHGRHVEVECVEADVTEPLPKSLQNAKFSSISMFNLLHCIPGGASHKLQSFRTLSQVLDRDGVLTGCTVLGEEYAPGWLSKVAVRHMNRKGIFHNLHDNREDADKALREVFDDVQTWVVGMVLLFKARKPRVELLVDV